MRAALFPVVVALASLAGCAPYTYDSKGDPVPYHEPNRATVWGGGRYENCGTPDQPRECVERRPSRPPPPPPYAPNYNLGPRPDSYRPY